ncbi:hypothetical protein E4K66_30750 [Bradyrhizobium frederickii]|uniref:Uncharacterized protein n=1 Tax=Bradyrhizobium frederickii TaxID=2560054 RepID=A0A4Y9KT36_9BRAD|nr:hypothetical protein [Bradyrhizobium frederickii]TFV34548.1 hypothetical protein E4K66_30750 [Bradyrhizobium frederickii]
MIFNDDEIAALKGDVQNIAAFFRLDTDPVIRLWLGFGNIVASANVLDPDGATYVGFGEIKDLPEFSQMINGAAERVDFTLSGVSGEVMQIAANNDADSIKGKRVSVGVGIFGADWQLLGAPHWLANYRADFLSIDQPPVTDPASPIVRTITLSCGTLLTSRRRPSFSYFSDQDQQARFPGDTFCNLAPRYATNFNKKWPKFPPP